MKFIKKIFGWLIVLFPMSASAGLPFIIGGAIAVASGIIGVSIWRSNSPVDMQEAFNYFSSCWTCQMFSDVIFAISNLLPRLYKAIGHIVIPMAAILLAVFVAWRLFYDFINTKLENPSTIVGNLGSYVVKLTLVIGLLLIPLPRLITDLFVEPAFTIGTSLNYVVTDDNNFSNCMVATAIADPVAISSDASDYGAFSPKLRHQLTCELANVHQITGLGLTVGWTLMGMAFNSDYMYKILDSVPIFPNVLLFLSGLVILGLFFYALLPIPFYFLEVFVTLSIDLIMLPLMLMAWMFDKDNFAIFPQGGKTIRQMIDDVIKAVIGIALTILFLTFSMMFLNATFGSDTTNNLLQQAIENNNSAIFLNGLMMQNNSIITVILMGIFIAMFMTLIPQLTSMLFKIKISDKYYQTVKKDMNITWQNLKKWASSIKK